MKWSIEFIGRPAAVGWQSADRISRRPIVALSPDKRRRFSAAALLPVHLRWARTFWLAVTTHYIITGYLKATMYSVIIDFERVCCKNADSGDGWRRFTQKLNSDVFGPLFKMIFFIRLETDLNNSKTLKRTTDVSLIVSHSTLQIDITH